MYREIRPRVGSASELYLSTKGDGKGCPPFSKLISQGLPFCQKVAPLGERKGPEAWGRPPPFHGRRFIPIEGLKEDLGDLFT